MSGVQERIMASNETVVDQASPMSLIPGDNSSGILDMDLALVDQAAGAANESYFLNEFRLFLERMKRAGISEGATRTYSAASSAESAATDATKKKTPEKAKQESANIFQTGANFQGSVNHSDINANQFATTGSQINYTSPPKRGSKD